MPHDARGLQINEDLVFQRKEWRAQRIGWFLLCAFVVAACLGLFGSGPLSWTRAGQEGSALWVEYDRFVRRGAPTRLTINLAPAAGGSTRQVRIGRGYAEGVRFERIVPEPDAIELGDAEAVLRFTGEAARSTTILLDVLPLTVGSLSASITVDGARPADVTHFVYF
jgi:hypothetical protein